MKYLKIVLLVLALSALLCVSALAAGTGVVQAGDENAWTYTATLENGYNTNGETAGGEVTVTAGTTNMYLLLVLSGNATTASFTADDILYIDQTNAETVAGTDTVTFSAVIPKHYGGGTAYIAGTTLASPVEVGTLESHHRVGDVNSDGIISAPDMQRLYQHLQGVSVLNNIAFGDINLDTVVNAKDMQRLYTHLQGISPL